MVFCSGCGKKLPPYPVRFCPECGNSITNTISGSSNNRSEQIEYRDQAQKIEGGNIQVQISKYAEYLVYEGEDADVLVRELKGGVYKIRIRAYMDKDDEFEEDTYFVRKSTLNEIFREYEIDWDEGYDETEEILDETGETITLQVPF